MPRAARFASSPDEPEGNPSDRAPVRSRRALPEPEVTTGREAAPTHTGRRAAPDDEAHEGPARAAFQPTLTGLPAHPTTPADESRGPVGEAPTEELPAVQDGPALFAWEDLTPRSSASTAMSQVPSPTTIAESTDTRPDDLPLLEDAPVEVPWTPDPDLAVTDDVAGEGSPPGPEHGAPADPGDREESDERRRWYALGALAVVLALAIFVAYMALGGRSGTAEPTPAASTGSPASAPSDPSSESPATGAAPSAGAGTASASSSGSASPQPSPTPSSTVLNLGDTKVTVLPGWEVYADEVVQDDRRLVRLKNAPTDTRIQIVTLTSITGDLRSACADLTSEHRQSYTDVAESATVNVSVAPGAGGVACGFTGTRASDNVQVKVDFTIVQRASDKASIVFRDVVPQKVPADSPARTELATIECGAADGFGVTISQCGATPGQGGG